MTQCQLDRAIAAAAGETVGLVRRLGVGLLAPDRPACPRRRHVRTPRRST